jgi:hypothetical protein
VKEIEESFEIFLNNLYLKMESSNLIDYSAKMW